MNLNLQSPATAQSGSLLEEVNGSPALAPVDGEEDLSGTQGLLPKDSTDDSGGTGRTLIQAIADHVSVDDQWQHHARP